MPLNARTEHASLLIQLWQMFPREAYRWFLGNFSAQTYAEFNEKCPLGSIERDYVAQLREFYETAGVILSHKLLDPDLFFDISYHIKPVWEKMGPFIKDWRRVASDPTIEENMEWLATTNAVWLKQVWKPGMKWKSPPTLGRPSKSRK